MDKKIEKIKNVRLFILRQIEGLTTEQLNAIPPGFNNNIIWNVGHLLSALQAVCYKRAGLPITINDHYFSPFLPSTKPENFIPAQEIEVIKKLVLSTIDTLQTDFEKKLFEGYTKSERIEEIYGIALHTIDDAIEFLLYHEGVHSGYIISLKRFV